MANPPTCSETILSTHRSIDGEIPKTRCNNEEKQQIPSSLAQSMNHPTKWWIWLLDQTNPLSQDADRPEQHSLSASSSHASSHAAHAHAHFEFMQLSNLSSIYELSLFVNQLLFVTVFVCSQAKISHFLGCFPSNTQSVAYFFCKTPPLEL